jgi:hypothetical protein
MLDARCWILDAGYWGFQTSHFTFRTRLEGVGGEFFKERGLEVSFLFISFVNPKKIPNFALRLKK